MYDMLWGKRFVFLMTYAVKAAVLMRLVPHIKARLTPVQKGQIKNITHNIKKLISDRIYIKGRSYNSNMISHQSVHIFMRIRTLQSNLLCVFITAEIVILVSLFQ